MVAYPLDGGYSIHTETSPFLLSRGWIIFDPLYPHPNSRYIRSQPALETQKGLAHCSAQAWPGTAALDWSNHCAAGSTVLLCSFPEYCQSNFFPSLERQFEKAEASYKYQHEHDFRPHRPEVQEAARVGIVYSLMRDTSLPIQISSPGGFLLE